MGGLRHCFTHIKHDPGMRFFFALLLKDRNRQKILLVFFSESPFVFGIACREIIKPKLP
jgi:hypothetical protein